MSQSRRFSELETYFIPPKEWSFYRDEFVNLTGTPVDAKLRLAERESELITLMGQVEELLAQSDSDLAEIEGSCHQTQPVTKTRFFTVFLELNDKKYK